jgi:hypothetical protein
VSQTRLAKNGLFCALIFGNTRRCGPATFAKNGGVFAFFSDASAARLAVYRG